MRFRLGFSAPTGLALAAAMACSDAAPDGVATPSALDRGAATANGVIPVGGRPFGKTYSQWSAAWWQWAYGVRVPVNPLLDTTGASCGAGQRGPVWFLAGVFNVTGTAVRNQCVVPAGKAIFFPVLNAECSNVEGNGSSPDVLRSCARGLMDLAEHLSAEVDSVPITPLAPFRVQSPPFGFTLPENNLLQLFGFQAPAGRCLGGTNPCQPYLSVGDGTYVMLSPLRAGAHIVHFHGEIPSFAFTLEVTYYLRVQS